MKKIFYVGFRSSQDLFSPSEKKDEMSAVTEEKSFRTLESDIIYFSAGPSDLKGTLLKQKPHYSA